MYDFDKEFDAHYKKLTKFFWVAVCIKAVVALSIIGGIGYVAFHFLQKVW